MPRLTLKQAEQIADRSLEKGGEMGLAPLTVVVLDAGGHVVVARRQDGAGILRFDIANGKAWGALGMGFGTREIAQRAEVMPGFINAIAVTSNGRIVPSPGGVLVAASGQVIGAVGISGDTGDHDELCAIAGIEAAALTAIPGKP